MSVFVSGLKDLVPFGIIGLAIAAVLAIVLSPRASRIQSFALAGIVIIAGLAIFDRWSQPRLELSPKPGPLPLPSPSPSPSPISSSYFWVDTRTNADWGGRDRAFTATDLPKYRVGDEVLCDENRAGTIATCWENRPEGYPGGNLPTDINRAQAPAKWCTYKDSTINLGTPPDGRAPKGRVYLCGLSMPRLSAQ
jgi:hypothetical protein